MIALRNSKQIKWSTRHNYSKKTTTWCRQQTFKRLKRWVSLKYKRSKTARSPLKTFFRHPLPKLNKKYKWRNIKKMSLTKNTEIPSPIDQYKKRKTKILMSLLNSKPRPIMKKYKLQGQKKLKKPKPPEARNLSISLKPTPLLSALSRVSNSKLQNSKKPIKAMNSKENSWTRSLTMSHKRKNYFWRQLKR